MHSRRVRQVAALLLFATALPQCGSRDCTGVAVWSFRVHVEDSVSGTAICDASVTASEGGTETQLTCLGSDNCPCVGVAEQLGTFQITVRKSGYQTRSTTIIVNESDDCHVVAKDATVKLDAE